MKRLDWFGPLVGGVMWITGLTFVVIAPVTGWIGTWPDWMKLAGTVLVALLISSWLGRRARKARLDLAATRAQVEAWEQAHPVERSEGGPS